MSVVACMDPCPGKHPWGGFPQSSQGPCFRGEKSGQMWPHTVRSAPGKVFWELFSRSAGSSSAFRKDGWWVGAPIDIMNNVHFNLLNLVYVFEAESMHEVPKY